MIDLLEPIRIIRLRRLKFRLDQILKMTRLRHIMAKFVFQMVVANQIKVYQQETLWQYANPRTLLALPNERPEIRLLKSGQ